MDEINITNAQYFLKFGGSDKAGIRATIDGEEMIVPLSAGNRHYDEIIRQVAAGTLTIQDAD
tara:strand:- start:3 stop:188 length:186 start_codon:yes stop_codon:yes gene_type:complete